MKRNTISFLVIVVMTLLTVSWGYSQETTPPPTPPVEQPTPAPEPVPEAVPVEEVVPMEEAVEEMEMPATSKGIRFGGGIGLSLSSSVGDATVPDNGMPIGGGLELSLAKFVPNVAQLKDAYLLVGFGVVEKKFTYGAARTTAYTEISALLKVSLPAKLPNNMKAYGYGGGVLSNSDNEKTNDKILQFGAGVEYPVNPKLSATATALFSMGLDNQLWLYGGDATRSGLGLVVGVLYAL